MTHRPALERLVSRALRLGLPAALHPAALAQAVVDAVLAGARGGEAPNRVAVRLSPEDARRLSPVLPELEAALAGALEDACRAAGLRPFAPWQLRFTVAAALPVGEPSVRADFSDPAAPASAAPVRETARIRRLSGLRFRLPGGGTLALTHVPFLLGRAPGCDAVIPDLAVSRRHAEIRTASGGGLEIHDLGSRNGTFRNGERIVAAPLQPGDRLALGPVELILEDRA